jgi:hypothetical protein
MDGASMARMTRLFIHIGEQRNLAARVFGNLVVGTADQNVGLQADGAQLLDGVLGRLGLGFAGRGDVGHQREVDEQRALIAQLNAHLAHGFHEGQRFDVAGGAADFDDSHVVALAAITDALLDGIGDVRNDLHGGAEIIATALFLDNIQIDAAGREIVALAHARVAQETLVVAQVQIRLGAVISHEDFAMLVGAHGARIDVDIRIHLGHRDLESARLEQGCEGGGRDPFTQ